MELRLRDSQNILNIDFGIWLIPMIKTRIISNYKKYNFVHWEKYLNETEDVIRLYTKHYSVFESINFACKNIVCDGKSGEISIHFNNNIYVPGFDRWKLSSFIKTINYGTLQIKGCPIFTDSLNEIAKDIDTYVGLYYNS